MPISSACERKIFFRIIKKHSKPQNLDLKKINLSEEKRLKLKAKSEMSKWSFGQLDTNKFFF